ncbi:hypothetical protein LENED_005050 [Lentinula edodes]|uniref:Uncharacterized protein n=1 Tax=Lentinula edodes TaxID=5353 RepID=A0A1Q3E7X6_LENED|nr:hypothetical protein LENED_005050 [Lentinula edodes]
MELSSYCMGWCHLACQPHSSSTINCCWKRRRTQRGCFGKANVTTNAKCTFLEPNPAHNLPVERTNINGENDYVSPYISPALHSCPESTSCCSTSSDPSIITSAYPKITINGLKDVLHRYL